MSKRNVKKLKQWLTEGDYKRVTELKVSNPTSYEKAHKQLKAEWKERIDELYASQNQKASS